MISSAPKKQALENWGQPNIRCSRWHRKLQMASTSLVLENLTVLCLIDLSRAFDSVWHPALFKKQSELGLPKCLMRSMNRKGGQEFVWRMQLTIVQTSKQEHLKASPFLCFSFLSTTTLTKYHLVLKPRSFRIM